MEQPRTPPTSLRDFKGKPPRVTPTTNPTDQADVEATRALIMAYTDKNGFHCPVCGVTITNPEEAVYHIAEEANKALERLGR